MLIVEDICICVSKNPDLLTQIKLDRDKAKIDYISAERLVSKTYINLIPQDNYIICNSVSSDTDIIDIAFFERKSFNNKTKFVPLDMSDSHHKLILIKIINEGLKKFLAFDIEAQRFKTFNCQ